MKIIGVDPGTNTTGYGIVTESGGRTGSSGWGAIRLNGADPLPERLARIAGELRKTIAEHKPDCLAMEESFFSKNAQSALKLGMARGVIMLVAAENGLPVHEYPPLLVKQTVVGYGRADKNQVRALVKAILGLKETPTPLDASDALAVAITHARHADFIRKTAP